MMKLLVRLNLALILAVSLAACGDDEPSGPPQPGPPTDVARVSGNEQTGTVGEELPEPLRVKVTDANNLGVPSVPVDFQVTVGGGSVAASVAGLSGGSSSGSARVVVTTDSNGEAQVTWTLGNSTGSGQSAVANIETSSGPRTATFSATAQAGAPDAIQAIGGTGQLGVTGQPLANPLAVSVTDQFGNPVPGATVNWANPVGSGTLSDMTTTTDSNGESSVTYTPGSAGPNQVTASVDGVTDPATFSPIGQSQTADPSGDNIPPFDQNNVSPDITDMKAWPAGGMLHVEITFANPVVSDDTGGPNVVIGLLDIDTDQDPNTGTQTNTDVLRNDGNLTGMGMDFFVSLFMAGTGNYVVVDVNLQQQTGTFVPTFAGNLLSMSIPLSMLGGDDGLVNLATILGTLNIPTDWAPNNGNLNVSLPVDIRVTGAPLTRPSMNELRTPAWTKSE